MVGLDSINSWAAGGATTAFGLNQYYKGKKMQRAIGDRPVYDPTPILNKNMEMAENLSQNAQGLPEEQKQQYLQNLQSGTAYGLYQLGDRKSGLSGIGNLNAQQNQGYSNLLAQDAAAKMQNQKYYNDLLMNQRREAADYYGQMYQVNLLNPYYEKTAEAQAMMGAGIQNIGNSFQIAGGAKMGGQNPYQNTASQSYNNNAQNGTVGLNRQGQPVQAMPGVNPANTNMNNTQPLTSWGGGLVANPSTFRQ